MQRFEKLQIWHSSVKLIKATHVFCLRLPSAERSVLIDQIKRASLSVALNIAEGSAADSDGEFARFLSISRKSLHEVIACLKIAKELYNSDIESLEAEYVSLVKQITSLITLLRKPKGH